MVRDDVSWSVHKKTVYTTISIVVVILLLSTSFAIINPGERGVVMQLGKPVRTMTEGLNFKMPVIDSVQKYDVKTQKVQTQATAASKDLQIVTSEIAVNFHLVGEGTLWVHQNVGKDYQEKIIDPSIQEVVKAAAAQFTAEELVTKRPIVREEMKKLFVEKMEDLMDQNVLVDEFNIVDFKFSPEFDRAIEQKVTAEQLALKAERDLERIKIEAQQKVAEAQGRADSRLVEATAEAEAISIITEQLRNDPGFLRLKAIEKWDGIMPRVTGGDTIPFIGIDLNE